MSFTPHQKRYFAEQLTLARPSRERDALAASMSGARIDLNPHQVEAALFALKSPISNGCLLADEVGLGKTIEAGLVIAQFLAERKQRILLILPASLRSQWKTELKDHFGIQCDVIERPKRCKGTPPSNPFQQAVHNKKVAICSYEYAAICEAKIKAIPWDLVIMDEAHRLRNVYKSTGSKRAKIIRESLTGRKKLLLTATPLQNDLKEMYGLATFIDEHIFGDVSVFVPTRVKELRTRLQNFCIRTLRKAVADTGYIKFTKRRVLTRHFIPGDAEQELYDHVSKYLQRPHVLALPNSGRQLVAMVIRKLLASSSMAISNTLQSLIDRLGTLRKKADDSIGGTIAEDNVDDSIEGDIAENFETYGEYSEEYANEDDNEGDTSNERNLYNQQEIMQEEELLRKAKALADSISCDAKGKELLVALQAGFEQVAANKGARKAVIFTESTRTQKYVFELLSENGYTGQVVLLNGSNNDEISRRIYADWKKRHKEESKTEDVSGSRTADMKAAIVEEFRERATILIGTEAAAEGINLQFCSMVVNYDLPWNPQRIEQRIGRCHRYGQEYDVVVVNFVNEKNAADKRVYELLEKKFQLFEGVFGASDEILGAIERGIDFEKAVYDIVQNCRNNEEIERRFEELKRKYDDIISKAKKTAVQQVRQFFDDNVAANLKGCEALTRASLDRFCRWKFNLFVAHGARRVSSEGWSFEYQGKRYIPSWEVAKKGGGTFLESDASIYTELRDDAIKLEVPVVRIRFDHSALPAEEQTAFFKNNIGLTGTVSVDKLIYNYGKRGDEKEEYILLSRVTNGDVKIDDEMFERMMEIPAKVIDTALPDSRLGEEVNALMGSKRADIDEANKRSFLSRCDELDAWQKDREKSLDKEIEGLQEEIKLLKEQCDANVGTLSFHEILDLRNKIDKLENECDRKQQRKLDSKEEIKKNNRDLRNEAMQQLNGTPTLKNIMTFSFEVV